MTFAVHLVLLHTVQQKSTSGAGSCKVGPGTFPMTVAHAIPSRTLQGLVAISGGHDARCGWRQEKHVLYAET